MVVCRPIGKPSATCTTKMRFVIDFRPKVAASQRRCQESVYGGRRNRGAEPVWNVVENVVAPWQLDCDDAIAVGAQRIAHRALEADPNERVAAAADQERRRKARTYEIDRRCCAIAFRALRGRGAEIRDENLSNVRWIWKRSERNIRWRPGCRRARACRRRATQARRPRSFRATRRACDRRPTHPRSLRSR